MVTFAKKFQKVTSRLHFCDICDFGIPRHPETIWIHSIFACWRFLMKFHIFYEKRKTKKRTWQKWFYRRLRSIFDGIFLRKIIFVKIQEFSSKMSTCKKDMNSYGFWMTFGAKSQNGENELNFWKFRTFSQLCGRQVLAAGISPLAEARMAHFSTFCTLLHF